MQKEPYRVISFGAGVQSTVMAVLAAEGAFGAQPDCAIFADTGWEPPHIYEHLDWIETILPFPVHRTSFKYDLRERTKSLRSYSDGEGYLDIPVYLRGQTRAENGIGARHCTENYKIMPIRRECRRLLGYGPRGNPPPGAVEQWMGISVDEAHRMKDSRVQWVVNRYPLIELGMSRRECQEWWAERFERPLLKSSCVGCPYQAASRWLDTKRRYPAIFAELVEIDDNLRVSGLRYSRDAYLHRSRRPLDQAVALTEAQKTLWPEADGFGEECEGHCGV